MVNEGNQKKLIDGNDIQDLTVVNMFNNEDGIYFISDKKGFFQIKNDKIVSTLKNSFPKLNNSLIYSAVKTESENYVLGSVMDGILIFDKKGNLVFNYTSRQGLANNTVLSTFVDNEDNLWTGLDNGMRTCNTTHQFGFIKIVMDHWVPYTLPHCMMVSCI